MTEVSRELKVGGKTYRVVTSAEKEELLRLAKKVEETLRSVLPKGREASAQALVLVAITLAHELEEEKRDRTASEQRYKSTLSALLNKVNHVIEENEPAVAKRKRKKKSTCDTSRTV